MKLFGAAVALAVAPGLADVANAPKMALLGIGLAFYAKKINVTLATALLLTWWGAASLGVLWSPAPFAGLRELWMLTVLILAFAVGQTGSAESLLEGAAWGTLVSVALAALDRWAGITLVPQAFPPSGFFSNKNFLGEASALLGLWMLLGRKYWLGTALCLGPFITNYRAGILVLALAGFYLVWERYKNLALVGGLFGAIAAWHFGSIDSLNLRWDIWTQALSNLTWFGHGSGSFSQLFPSHNLVYDLMIDRPEHPHNELVNQVFTLGVFALLPIAVFVWVCANAPRKERIWLFAALAPIGFSFPLQLPISLLALGLVAGSADRNGRNLGNWLLGRRGRIYAFLAPRAAGADSRGAKAS